MTNVFVHAKQNPVNILGTACKRKESRPTRDYSFSCNIPGTLLRTSVPDICPNSLIYIKVCGNGGLLYLYYIKPETFNFILYEFVKLLLLKICSVL